MPLLENPKSLLIKSGWKYRSVHGLAREWAGGVETWRNMVLFKGGASETPQVETCTDEMTIWRGAPGCWQAGGHPGPPGRPTGAPPPLRAGSYPCPGDIRYLRTASWRKPWGPVRAREEGRNATHWLQAETRRGILGFCLYSSPSTKRTSHWHDWGCHFGPGPRIKTRRTAAGLQLTLNLVSPWVWEAEVDGQRPSELMGKDIP